VQAFFTLSIHKTRNSDVMFVIPHQPFSQTIANTSHETQIELYRTFENGADKKCPNNTK